MRCLYAVGRGGCALCVFELPELPEVVFYSREAVKTYSILLCVYVNDVQVFCPYAIYGLP